MGHVSDFTRPEDQIVLDLINFDNGSSLNKEQVSLSLTEVLEGGKCRVGVSPLTGSGYVGEPVPVDYGRLDIQGFLDLHFPDGLVIQQGEAVSIIDLLDEINVALGLAIPSESVVDAPIGPWTGTLNETKQVSFQIAPSSMVYTGSSEVTVDGNDISLLDLVTVRVLSGLNLPAEPVDPPSEWTRFTVATASVTAGADFTIVVKEAGSVSYQFDSNPIVELAVGTIAVVMPPGISVLSLRNTGTATITSSGTKSLKVAELLEMQATANPLIGFAKTGTFNKVPDKLPPEVLNLSNLFYGAQTFNQDLSGWNTSNVTNMFSLFRNSVFNWDISGWNTSNVTNMQGTFNNASRFNQDLSGWDVSKVTISSSFATGATAWVLPKPTFNA